MAYSMTHGHATDATTLLIGSVVDQAALQGLLGGVRDVGMPLVSVNLVARGPADSLSRSLPAER